MRVSAVLVFEEGRQSIAVHVAGLCFAGWRRAERLGQPLGVLEQTFGLARHVCLFEVIDHACELLAARFGDVGENPRLGDAPEVAVDGRSPACGYRIKTNGPREDVAMGKTALDAVLRYTAIVVLGHNLALGIHAARSTMSEQGRLLVAVEGEQRIPQISV